MSVDNYSVLHIILQFVQFLIKTREPTPVSPLTSYILHPEGHPSSSPPVVPPPWLPPSVMSSSPDAAAAACGSTFCQLTSSENWRLNFAATVQPSRLLPLAALSISAVATFRVPRPSGDGYRSALPLATEGTQECRGRFVGEGLHYKKYSLHLNPFRGS